MAIKVGARIDGLAELYAALGSSADQLDAAIADVLNATGLELETEIKRRYDRSPATGRIYQKYNPRRTHQASAPGQPPRSDTGRLSNSVLYRKVSQLVVEVVTAGGKDGDKDGAIKYAAALEYGTATIKPRPLWRQVALEAEPKLKQRLERTVAAFTR